MRAVRFTSRLWMNLAGVAMSLFAFAYYFIYIPTTAFAQSCVCYYNNIKYTPGSCVKCQKCHNSGTFCYWFDDRACSTCTGS